MGLLNPSALAITAAEVAQAIGFLSRASVDADEAIRRLGIVFTRVAEVGTPTGRPHFMHHDQTQQRRLESRWEVAKRMAVVNDDKTEYWDF